MNSAGRTQRQVVDAVARDEIGDAPLTVQSEAALDQLQPIVRKEKA
jgi:hypothetical protein